MIPPAPVRGKWTLLATATLIPLTLIGVGIREQLVVQARQSDSTANSTTFQDGIYLYGNSPQPNQLLHNYVVFEQQNGKVVGAFYSPQSDFTCFAGDRQGTQLQVKAIAPEQPSYDVKTQLSNLNAISPISSNDQRILATCKQTILSLASK